MIRAIKAMLGSTAQTLRLTDLLFRYRNVDTGIIVLTFHRVVPKPYFRPGMTLSTSAFSSLLDFLAKHFEVVDLAQAVDSNRPRGHRLRVALTFDDGYRDNFDYAYPALKRHGFPATIYLATQYMDDPALYLWWDRLAHAFSNVANLSSSKSNQLVDTLKKVGIQPSVNELSLDLLNRVVDHLKVKSTIERESVVNDICAITSNSNTSLPRIMLSWDEIRTMAQGGIVFGGHTVSHPNLAELSAEALQREIEQCRNRIEHETGQKVTSFAYPSGCYSRETVASLQAANYRTAVTTEYGIYCSGQDPFQIPRISIADDVIRGVNEPFSIDMWHFELLRKGKINHGILQR